MTFDIKKFLNENKIIAEGVMKYASRGYEELKDAEDNLHYALGEAQGYKKDQRERQAIQILQSALAKITQARRELKKLNSMNLR